tara:strand:+ start:2411 stop:3172 length:762 start_codon:yes stop_codon:yes gene_type:complete
VLVLNEHLSMKRLILTIIYIQIAWSQADSLDLQNQSSIDSVSADSASQVESALLSDNESTVLDPSIPLTLDAGYKGFLWGSGYDAKIFTNFSEIMIDDSLLKHKSFTGRLGPDSVVVHYFFADSGFWKAELDFHLDHMSVDAHIKHFLRHEKNISEVYGPPSKINQKESGVSSVYSNTLDQKFSNAFYRSTWKANPAVIELYLNSSILMPKTNLSIFSGNYSVLKLVYYNPDYMHSSEPTPEPKSLPSIFDIY